MCLMAGMMRRSSSSTPTEVEPGRVLSPPMSMIVAPEAMKLRTVAVRVSGLVGGCLPPSEKESGVRLRMAIMCVRRLGSFAWRGGNLGEM